MFIVNLVRITHEKYIKLEKTYSSHPEKIFEQMPTLQDVLSNIDDQNRYQGATLKNLEHEKEYLESNVSCLIQDIFNCFEQGYGDLMDEDATSTVKETTEGDRLLSHICKVLNRKVWPNKISNVEEVMMKKQLSSIKAIYNQYCQVSIFQGISFQQIKGKVIFKLYNMQLHFFLFI